MMLRALLIILFATTAALAQQPRDWGPVTAYSAAVTLSPPASLAGSGAWTSPCVAASYARAFTAFAALAAAGTTSAQRYADATCAQPVGAAVPASPLVLTSGGGCPGTSFCGSNSSNDGLPYAALKVTITDTSTSTNSVVAVTLLLGAE